MRTETVGIAIFLLIVLLAAGCISPSTPIDSRENSGVPTTTFSFTPSPPTTFATVQCLQENQSPFINISPITDHYLGDTITIEGTTNMLPGETIDIAISESWGRCGKCQIKRNDSVDYCCGEFFRKATIRRGECSINVWSLDVNTSYHDFRTDEYLIEAYGRNYEPHNSLIFNVTSPPKPDLFHYITISPPAIRKGTSGFSVHFSGRVNTDNGPRERLSIQISTESGIVFNSTIPVIFDETGYSWNYTVQESQMSPLINYTVHISSVYSPKIGNISTFTA